MGSIQAKISVELAMRTFQWGSGTPTTAWFLVRPASREGPPVSYPVVPRVIGLTSLFSQICLSSSTSSDNRLTEPSAFVPSPESSKWSQSGGASASTACTLPSILVALLQLATSIARCRRHAWQKREVGCTEHYNTQISFSQLLYLFW